LLALALLAGDLPVALPGDVLADFVAGLPAVVVLVALVAGFAVAVPAGLVAAFPAAGALAAALVDELVAVPAFAGADRWPWPGQTSFRRSERSTGGRCAVAQVPSWRWP
jgi:hypothetical protein